MAEKVEVVAAESQCDSDLLDLFDESIVWLGGAFELVVSEALLAELDRALAYPKLGEYVGRKDAAAFIELLRSTASMFADAEHAPHVSRDPGDDYLVALATASASIRIRRQ